MPKIIANPQEIILEHAKKILAQQGYDALNMRAIAKSCEIGTGTIYNYFPTKKDLLLQMMADYWDNQFIIIDSIAAEEENLFVKLKRVYLIMQQFVSDFREVWIGMRQEKETTCSHEEIHQNQNSMEKLIEKIENILMQEKNSVNYPLPVKEIAAFIFQNDLALCHMGGISYDAWELLLKKVLAGTN